ncbi:hypothetical protein Nepgr_022895 [Nepenthes gracilis]|uniref:Uncharacterized protein n=1 Tax=Nepenthes gracilis TaxID=150966 RepID=A0AAD3T139_NEPGR|nr:hypothetical protein Nepgr_022895 [Nepenthes gracilis]
MMKIHPLVAKVSKCDALKVPLSQGKGSWSDTEAVCSVNEVVDKGGVFKPKRIYKPTDRGVLECNAKTAKKRDTWNALGSSIPTESARGTEASILDNSFAALQESEATDVQGVAATEREAN